MLRNVQLDFDVVGEIDGSSLELFVAALLGGAPVESLDIIAESRFRLGGWLAGVAPQLHEVLVCGEGTLTVQPSLVQLGGLRRLEVVTCEGLHVEIPGSLPAGLQHFKVYNPAVNLLSTALAAAASTLECLELHLLHTFDQDFAALPKFAALTRLVLESFDVHALPPELSALVGLRELELCIEPLDHPAAFEPLTALCQLSSLCVGYGDFLFKRTIAIPAWLLQLPALKVRRWCALPGQSVLLLSSVPGDSCLVECFPARCQWAQHL